MAIRKLKKAITALAVLAGAVAIHSQTVTFHGYVDYSMYPLAQTFSKDAEGEKSHTDPSAEFGSFCNGTTEFNTFVDMANFHFALGIKLNATLGSLNEDYKTADEYSGLEGVTTYFHQGNVRVDLLKGQFRVLAGKFDDWNGGYVADGYVMEGQNVRNLADKDQGQHFAGIEILPYGIRKLSIIGGFPILPVSGNGVDYAEHNKWKNLAKKVKIMAKWKLDNGASVAGGFRPETHYEGTSNYSEDSYFSEAFMQINSPKASENFAWNATYDFRYRDVEELDKKAFMHYAGISSRIRLTDYFTLNAEYRLAYASEDYVALDERLFYETLGLCATYDIPNTSFQTGLKIVRAMAKDGNGSLFGTDARVQGNYSDDLAMTVDWMPFADDPGAGSKGTYHSLYAYPYFQRTFRNGYLRTGVEIQLTLFDAEESTKAFGYRVPLAMCFRF